MTCAGNCCTFALMADYAEITFRMDEINKRRPFEGESLGQLKKYYKVQTTWSSNAVEGNSISLSETEMILENGITIHGHTINEIHECIGHGEAYDYMFTLIGDKSITESDVKTMHRLFAANIKDIPCPGEYRDKSKTCVRITGSGYAYPDWRDVPEKMHDWADWLDAVRRDDVFHPVELAAEAHRRLVYIHPFPDGNGRVARLVMNAILLQEHYLPVSIPPRSRPKYVRLLENGRTEPQKFTDFISELELKEERDFMRAMRIETPLEKELRQRIGSAFEKRLYENCRKLDVQQGIDKTVEEVLKTSKLGKKEFRNVIARHLADKGIYDRNGLADFVKAGQKNGMDARTHSNGYDGMSL